MYCEYRFGSLDTKLVLVAPHAGYLIPTSFPDRRDGCLVNGTCIYHYKYHCETTNHSRPCKVDIKNDFLTKRLTNALAEAIYNITNLQPHVIINYLGRIKVDMNRPLNIATFHHPSAVLAYREFHRYIALAKSLVGRHGDGTGLLIDVHGQNHAEGWIELGYALSKDLINKIQDLSSNKSLLNQSSIRSLAQRVSQYVNFEDLVRGTKSLGKYLQGQNPNFTVVPSPKTPRPDTGGYFCCNHIIKTHGSRHHGNIDAVQVETPRKYREDDTYNRYVNDLATAVVHFMKLYRTEK